MNNQAINKAYRVGIYIRLSIEDDDKDNTYKNESESITNQRSLLMQYIKENGYHLVDEYIDDGYSGTNFDRPDFKRMINDIEIGRINMVITKDLSRLGRDYIGTGQFIEKWFPEHGVRYIAVTDNIDTFLDSTNNDITPFKALINDFYARDISKKVKSSLHAKMKAGKYVGGRAPFGYDQDPENKNHLIVNEEQALTVKRIFELAKTGLGYCKIATILTNEHVKTPAQYYQFEWCGNYNYHYGLWHGKSVEDILKNRLYTGDLVQNRRKKVNYKVRKIVKNDPSEFIIVENTHEAIIDKETFEYVQKMLPKSVGRSSKKENHLFDGLMYCHECGYRISVCARKKSNNLCYTICNHYRTFRHYHACTPHTNNYDKLEQTILDTIRKECTKYLDKQKIKNSIDINNMLSGQNIESQKKILLDKIDSLTNQIDEIYMDKLNGIIDNTQYMRIKNKIEEDIKKTQDSYNKLTSNNNGKRLVNEKKINKYINDFLSLKNPSRELIINLIDRIEIAEDKSIKIQLSFSNIL